MTTPYCWKWLLVVVLKNCLAKMPLSNLETVRKLARKLQFISISTDVNFSNCWQKQFWQGDMGSIPTRINFFQIKMITKKLISPIIVLFFQLAYHDCKACATDVITFSRCTQFHCFNSTVHTLWLISAWVISFYVNKNGW